MRVIRSLMERATVYRAISAPTALVGGILSVAAASWSGRGWPNEMLLPGSGAARNFIVVWLGVLVATLLANTWFIWRKSRRERGSLITSGLKWAIKSAAPVVAIAAIVTSLFWRENETAESVPLLVLVWIICYALALLATASFAPPSLIVLGWMLLGTGAVGLIWTERLFSADPAARASLAMGVAFGLYHLVYAATTWPRKSDLE